MTLCLDNLVNPSEALEEIANNWEQVITNMDVFHLVAIPSQLFKELFQLKSFRSIQDTHLRYCQTDLFAQIQNDEEGGIKEK